MTLEEAKKVAAICSEADGRCQFCVSELRDLLSEAFPEFVWTFDLNHQLAITVAICEEGTQP